MSVIERAGKAVAVELGYCDPDEWGTDECNREDRDTALRAAAAALDAANCEGAVEDRDALRTMLKRLLDVALVDGYGETVRDEAEALLTRLGGQ